MKTQRILLFTLCALMLSSACSGPKEVDGFETQEGPKKQKYFLKGKYERILLSDDVEFKLERAKYFYNKGEYGKAIPIFEQLLGLVRGTSNEEEVRYFLAYSHYLLGEMTVASYMFKRVYIDYNSGKYAEDATFMTAEALYANSPKYYLDQSSSLRSIDAYRLFINTYPESAKRPEALDRIVELKGRLEKKMYTSAELYYNLEYYEAAAITYRNLMKDHPSTERAEEVTFLIFKSLFKYADNSIPSKKAGRFEEALSAYYDFTARYPQSKYSSEAKVMLDRANGYLTTKNSP